MPVALPSRRALLVLASVSLVIFAGHATAQTRSPAFFNGTKILQLCQSRNTDACAAYIAGIVDEQSFLASTTDRSFFCFPSDVTLEKLRQILVKSLNSKPDRLKLAAGSLAHSAFADAFPCPGQKP